MPIKVVRTRKYIKIYIAGILHVAIQHNKLSVQSWIQGNKNKWYYIELTGSKGSEWMKYDNRERWVQILNAIDKVL